MNEKMVNKKEKENENEIPQKWANRLFARGELSDSDIKEFDVFARQYGIEDWNYVIIATDPSQEDQFFDSIDQVIEFICRAEREEEGR